MMKWDDLQIFLKIAQTGTLKQAAAALKLNGSTVFRRLNAMEESLRVRLFERLPGGYALTAAGEQLLGHAERIEAEMLAARTTLEGQNEALAGTIHVTTTPSIANSFLPPVLAAFQAQYPGICLMVQVSNQMLSLSRREADVAIAAGRREKDEAIGRRLCGLGFGLYAARSYCERFGPLPPSAPWGGHRFLLPAGGMEALPVGLWLKRQIVDGAIAATADEFLTLQAMARAGMGIAPLPDHLAAVCEELVCLRTVPEVPHSGLWLYHHPAVGRLARVKAFTGFLAGRLAESTAPRQD